MSLDKAIEHGKEKRKPYRGAKAVDGTCRNHGFCKWCETNRKHKFRDKHPAEGEELAMFKDRIDTQPPFGSIGDSVDLADVWLKQHSSSTPATTTTGPINSQYCGQRLPCGICRMTMMQCPMQVQRYEVTCSSQTGTTGDTNGAAQA